MVSQAKPDFPPEQLLRSFDDFHQTPALFLAQGAGFHDANHIAGIACIFFIMREELLRAQYELAIQRVHKAAFHLDSDCFIHFIGYNHAGLLFAKFPY
jgi:hypothetical protein